MSGTESAPGAPRRPSGARRLLSLLRHRAAGIALLLVAITIGGWGLRASLALGGWTISQPFSGSTASGWTTGGPAVLTASNGTDAAGSGWLRLTAAGAASTVGYAWHGTAFTASQGLQVEFDWASWGGTGASGLGLVLFDGSIATPTPGDSGGALGIGPNGATPGWSGTYLGIGLDEAGGSLSGGVANSVAVVGAGNGTNGYALQSATALGASVQTAGRSTTAGDANYRRLRVTLLPASPSYRLTVTALVGAGSITLLDNVAVPAPAMATLKVALTGANGSSTNTHEIRNFSAGPAPRITGTVFEDPNYGGGPGRNRATALATGGSGRANARVELFDSGGNLLGTTTTDSAGAYSIPAAAGVAHTVRVVGSSVSSGRSGWTASLLPVQTYRVDASTGTATDLGDRVGGENPALGDAGNAATTLAALTTASTTAQSIATVKPGSLGIDGIDFGFNFDTLVNVNDSGAGSLRQVITNANTLAGDATLAQAGRTAGIENLVFMIPNGTTGAGGSLSLAAGGLRASRNQFSGGAATITPSTALPLVTATLVIDASTQPGWAGNPIVALNGTAVCAVDTTCQGLQLWTGNGGTVRGLQFAGWIGTGARALHVVSSNHWIAGNWFGLQPDGTASTASRNYQSIALRGTGAKGATVGGTTAVDRNLVANTYSTGIYLYGADNATIIGNWFGLAADGQTRAANMISIATYAGGTIIGGTSAGQGNVFGAASTNSYGHILVDTNLGNVTNAGATIQGNRFGFTATGTALSASAYEAVQFIGVPSSTLGGTAAGAGNIITGTIARAVSVYSAAQKVSVRGNAMYGNGGIGIDLNRDGITANDGATNAAQANNGIDSPVFTSATLTGTTLTVAGYIGSAAGQSAFGGASVDVYQSDGSSSNGSGQTYLGSLTAAANGNFTGSIANVSGLASGARITAVATDANGNSSEFGVNFTVGTGIAGTVFEDLNYGGGPGRSLAASSGAPIAGARVELYDASGNYLSATTTAADGSYAFASLSASTTYHVRVATGTVLSTRSGATSSLPGVLTYRTSTTAGTVSPVTDTVGGINPAVADTGSAASGAVLSTSTYVFSAGTGVAGGTAHAAAPVGLGTTGASGVDFGFNFSAVVNVNDSGQGSLRQALINANTLGGDAALAQVGRGAGIENLVFMIPNGTTGAGGSLGLAAGGLRASLNYFTTSAGTYNVATIAPSSATLPAVTSPLVIDAQTQPGWTLNPIVELSGVNLTGANYWGLSTSTASLTVRGLIVNRWSYAGIESDTSGFVLQGCWLGINAAGTAAAANGSFNVVVGGGGTTNALIGGTTAAQRNVIAGAGTHGVLLQSNGNVVTGNYIGTDPTGQVAIPNASTGVRIRVGASNNTIGGSAAGAGNVISGNLYGIWLSETATTANVIKGNRIGVAADGVTARGNTYSGILLDNATSTVIGGVAAGEGNVIASNGANGVTITSAATGTTVRGNAIYGNTGPGIDLANNGITANDGAKTTGQPNLLMDWPVFTQGSMSGTTLTVAGYVGSAAGQTTFGGATVDVYRSDVSRTNGSGQAYLGTLTADANGNFSGTIANVSGLTAGSSRITGVATDAGGNSSEFGLNFTVGLTLAGTVFEDVNYGGGPGRSLATATGALTPPSATPATVELYDASGAYVASTATGTTGAYAFTSLAAGSYYVRVAGGTVKSARTGGGTAGLLAVPTYRTDGTSGTATDVVNLVGGTNPAAADAGTAASGAVLNTTTSVFSAGTGVTGGTAQAVAPVTLSSAGVTGVDFGFNFSTVVNVNDTGQGSLRQAITNANALGGDAALAQAGRAAGIENLVFMIPNGTTGAGGSLSLAAGGLRSTVNLFSGGAATITVATGLPLITQPLVIDAQTQPGWSASPLVMIDGSATGAGTSGLGVYASTVTIRGFAIGGFKADTGSRGIIVATGSGSATIQGNWLGLNAAGVATPNAYGLRIADAANVLVGGTTATARNVISGNTYGGIYVSGTGTTNLLVQGNYLGTSTAGLAGPTNGGSGIQLTGGASATVGGATTAHRNVIGGFANHGVEINANATAAVTINNNYIGIGADGVTAVSIGYDGVVPWSNTTGVTTITNNVIGSVGRYGIDLISGAGHVVKGNRIGTAADGTTARPATTAGIYVSSSTANTIGGVNAGEGNTIAWSPRGVSLASTTSGNTIRGNAIFGNTTIGIDLGADGYTANDGALGSAGVVANLGMDTPVIYQSVVGPTTLTVSGHVGSAANQTTFASATIDLYESDGSRQGKRWLGQTTTDSLGAFVVTLESMTGLTAGTSKIVATATNSGGNTSEFSADSTTVALQAFRNGSFETATSLPALSSYNSLAAGSTNMDGWVVRRLGVNMVGSGLYQSAAGNMSVDLNDSNPGGLLQTFQTVPGTRYWVTFSTAGNTGCPTVPVKTMSAGIAPNVTNSFSFDTTGKTATNMGYVTQGFAFTATSEASTLVFDSTNTLTCGIALDAVATGTGPMPLVASGTAVWPGMTATLPGLLFGATQGTGKIELASSSDYGTATKVAQAVSSWSDTAIVATMTPGSLPPGPVWLFVTDASGARSAGVQMTAQAANGLVGWWKLDETSGTTAADASGYANPGVVTATTTAWGVGRIGNAFVGTGSNAITVTPASPITPYQASRTVSVRFRLDSVDAVQRAIASTGDSGNENYPLWLLVKTTANKLSIYHGGNYRTGTTTLATDTWYHAVYTYDVASNAVRLYLNGNLEYSGTVTEYAPQNKNSKIYIAAGYPNSLNGGVDDLRIFNRALSQNEAQAIYAEAPGPLLSGRVFEDFNYGGGPGRARADAGGVDRPSARVELYNGSGNFVTALTTDATGTWSWRGLAPGSYSVRVASGSVSSSRTGYGSTLLPVLTYRTDASGGTATPLLDRVGGESPALADAGSNTTSATLASLTTASTVPQAVTPVTVATADIGSLDFGFNFSTIVNVNDTGAGSLRQAITNANALGGDAALAQAGRPAGIENLVFMIPNGTTGAGGSLNLAAGGLRASLNLFSGGVATIAPATALPNVGAALVLDAQTQPGWTQSPIVQLSGTTGSRNSYALYLGAAPGVVRGWIINRFDGTGWALWANAGPVTVQGNWIGLDPTGVAAGNYQGVRLNGAPGSTVGGTTAAQGNVMSGNTYDGLTIVNGSTDTVIRGNRFGTDPTGTLPVPNGRYGINLGTANATGAIIGGTDPGAGNLISGNGNTGLLAAGNGAVIQGNLIGTNAAGTAPLPNGVGGINVSSASNVQIGGSTAAARNVISGNTGVGLTIGGTGSTGVVVRGNYIGTTAAGDAALGNTNRGLYVTSAPGLVLGGSGAGEGNVISGNGSGNYLNDIGGALIQGNVIGLNAAGTAKLSNTGIGLQINASASVTIGGTTAGAANVIAGSTSHGLYLDGAGSTGPTILRNRIGVDATGTIAFGNSGYGIYLGAGVSGASVGSGEAADLGNVIANNTSHGLSIVGTGCTVKGNRIGTDVTGTVAMANSYGVSLYGASNTIGGTGPYDRNLVSGNTNVGIYISTAAAGTVVKGNYVGVNAAGDAALRNASDGIQVVSTNGVTIGGAESGAGNLVSGNGSAGVRTNGASNIVVQGNVTGLNAAGTARIDNYWGMYINSGSDITIGGTATGAGNVIAGNTTMGLLLYGSTTRVTVQGNRIGTNAAGDVAIANTSYGLYVSSGSSATQIGGATVGAGNLISGNGGTGVTLDTGSVGTTVLGNVIGLNAAGTAKLGNGGNGMQVLGTGTQIGGTTSAERNLIGGNTAIGINVVGANTTVTGNWIGVDASGAVAVGNGTGGIVVSGASATGVTIGGTTAGAGNLISGNTTYGVQLSAVSGAVVQGNTIGLNAAGTAKLPNTTFGLWVSGNGNTIGGASAGAGNLISGNGSIGVQIAGTTSTGNVIQGNRIGTTAAGGAGAGNATDGVLLVGPGNTVGGVNPGEANTIAYNGRGGVTVTPTTYNTPIRGNAIFANTGQGIDLGNNATVQANDGVKGAAGSAANLGMDFPVITRTLYYGGTLSVKGYVGSAANQTVFAGAIVDVYESDGARQGKRWLGSLTADANGAFDGVVGTVGGLTGGTSKLTTTATDGSGNTSEFGAEVTLFGGLAIRGTVYEDVQYGGGPGRDRATALAAGGSGRPGVRVELYDSVGAFAGTATTDANGAYAFAPLYAGSYSVRVAHDTVSSARTGFVAGTHLPVQLFRTDASGATVTAVADRVGGESPTLADAPSNTSSATLASLTVTGATAQSVTPATLSTADATGVDFGFHFATVVNVNDAGAGSLRQAIVNANALGDDATLAQAGRTAGIEHVVFMIPNGTTGAGGSLGLAAGGLRAALNAFATSAGSYTVATISPLSALPAVTSPLVIDAQTQPGWTLNPVVELNGAGAGSADGVTLNAAGTVVRGLIVNRFGGNGLYSTAGAGITIQGVWSGLDATGKVAAGNTLAAASMSSTASGHVIGGTTAAQRNVFSASVTSSGLALTGGSGHVVQGNYVGTDAAGTAALPNQRYGILIGSGVSGSTAGGSVAGAGNLVSGNRDVGLLVQGSGITVTGNRVGTDAAGNAALPNAGGGIQVDGSGNTIGGASALEANQVTGRSGSSFGIRLAGNANMLRNALVGLNAGGTAALSAPYYGVVTVGNTATIQDSTIGGTALGIWVGGGSGSTIRANRIGTDASGTVAIGSTGEGGIVVSGGTDTLTIGGTGTGDGNVIANGGTLPGVLVRADSPTVVPQRIRIVRNTLYGNAPNRGIDLAQGDVASGTLATGPHANDGVVSASQPNNGIDTPVFTMTGIVSNQFRVSGYVGSAAGQSAFANATVDVYKSTASTGFGEGRTWVGSLTTDAAGNFSGTIVPPTGVTVAIGDAVTATATDAAGNTSEFAANGVVSSVLIVNDTGDATDATPGDGVCATVNGGAVCTLRAAIAESNAAAGMQTIRFGLPNCPGTGCTIAPASALPAFTDTATLDGQTQPGWSAASGAPNVRLDGVGIASASQPNGLTVSATPVTIRGLSITRFWQGVWLNATATGATVAGNWIGVAPDGTAAGNGANGVVVQAVGAVIGLPGTTGRNVLSANDSGVVLLATGTTVQNNYVGTDPAGAAALGTQRWGVYAQSGSTGAQIGGSSAEGRGNLISGNTQNGIRIDAGVHTVQGNLVGTDVAGLQAVPNKSTGILLMSSAGATTIGGTSAALRNVVSANGSGGVAVSTATASGTVIQGNYIGTDALGTGALGNTGTPGGVWLSSASTGVTVGGAAAGAGNVISANANAGVRIEGGTHVVQGNLIGTDANGTRQLTSAVANVIGILQTGATTSTTIGGLAAGAGNLISGNTSDGMRIDGGSTVLLGNRIGTDAAGTAKVANSLVGLRARTVSTASVVVGGTAAGAGNLISGNAGNGILIEANVQGVSIQGNVIGLAANGATALGNSGTGVQTQTVGTVTIGGTAAGAGNTISSNGADGVILDAGTPVVQGNRIGTDVSGLLGRGNGQSGVRVRNTASTGALIGGDVAGAGNVISGNGQYGLYLEAGPTGTTIQGNIVGLGADGSTTLANPYGGLNVLATGTLIGGETTAARNVISGNGTPGVGYHGITVCAAGTRIRYNYIGTDRTGLLARGNQNDGVYGCNTFTGTVQLLDNVISGNGRFGATVYNANVATAGLGGTWTMLRNIVGLDATGGAALPNGWRTAGAGIALLGTNAAVGDGTVANGNLIAGNTGPGVLIGGSATSGNAVLVNRIRGNSGLGIDLGTTGFASNGVTANDGTRTAGQPNLAMDFPVITSARARGTALTIAGYVGSAAGQATFAGSRVDVYQSDGDSSGYGEGAVWLGTLTADASGNFSGTLTTPVPVNQAGTKLTALATDTAGNTSEFGPQFSGTAVDWVVNDTGDAADAVAGDGICATATGVCTLRAAIQESNASAGADYVAFALPGCGSAGQAACTIAPAGTALPTIGYPLTVDGSTQAAADGSPLVEITGGSAGAAANGLTINATPVIVRGLVINGFGGSGVAVAGAGTNAVIAGMRIGLRADGLTGRANNTGISVATSGVTIGGSTAADRNVIAGNTGNGILLSSGTGIVVQGNYIGTTASGLAALSNGYHGVRSTAGVGATIGGAAAGQGNVVGGGGYDGLALDGTGGTVLGNRIGLGADGTTRIPVGRNGLYLMSGTWTVGGTAVGEANQIVGSGTNGVLVQDGATARIVGNAIYDNVSLGIDLGGSGAANSGLGNGATANDGLKPAGTANLGMDTPVINSVGTDGATLFADGYVGSATDQTLFAGARIDLYLADTRGQGKQWLGTLTAGADARFSGSIALAAGAFATGNVLTATATDAAGNTSEFATGKTSVSMAQLLPGSFDAYVTDMAGLVPSRRIGTQQVSGTLALNVLALDAAGTTTNTAWQGTVTVDLVRACSDTGAPAASTTATFTAASRGLSTAQLALPEAGRSWRVRLSASAGGTSVSACSSDAFAIRPADLAITAVGDADAGTAGLQRPLTNGAAAGGVVHRAGQPFSLRAAARTSGGALTPGYDGTPRLSVSGCVQPAAGCVLGSVSSSGLAATGGVIASDTLTYSEAGSIVANLVDDTFADVDAADTPLSMRTINGTPVTIGRFVPDHYRLSVSTAGRLGAVQNACAATGKGFTFVGQNFGWATAPRVTVTAENASGGVTRNWTGALQKIVPASHVSRAQSLTGAGSLALAPTWDAMTVTDAGGGTATVAFSGTDRFLFGRDAAVPVASFQPSIDFVIGVADTSEGGVSGNPTIAALSTVRASNASALPFDNGGYFHYGRLKLQNAFGDARRNVSGQVELQYYDGTNWLRLDDDRGCLTMNANAFGITSANGFLASNACAAPVQAAVTTSRGRATVTLGKSPSNLPGSASLVINALTTTEGASCVGSPAAAGTPVSLAMPYLATVRDTANLDANPLARIVWGRSAREWISLREVY